MMRDDTVAQTILRNRMVITTSKCYKHVQEYANEHHIDWDHIVIDEASSIYFHSNDPPLRFQFLWLVASNWIPLIMKNASINKNTLHSLRDRVDLHPDLEDWLLEEITAHYEGQLISSAFLKDYLALYHPHRTHMVLRNANKDIESSMMLPPINHNILRCKPNLTFHSLISYYLAKQKDPSIRSSQIPYLFQGLGITFRSAEEYKDQQPDVKHELIDRMIHDQECVICFEPCEYPTMVNCCYHLFCGKCLLKNAILTMKCPTCREPLQTDRMCCLQTLPIDDERLARSKLEICMDMIHKNKNGRFIVYSPFINMYYELFEEIDKLGIKSERIENNLFSQIKTIRNYQQGNTTLIFISNVDAIRGINLTSTTHLIFYHAPSSYEIQQELIRSSQRLGRKLPLQILHLQSEIRA
jgi:SNF2 family DNA or RNA helicase